MFQYKQQLIQILFVCTFFSFKRVRHLKDVSLKHIFYLRIKISLIPAGVSGFLLVFLPLVWPMAKKLGTGNQQADASDSHQGQSVKPLPDFQVSLREKTRGRVKPGWGEEGGGECGGEFGIGWRMWLDYWLTTPLVHHSNLDEKSSGGRIINLEKARLNLNPLFYPKRTDSNTAPIFICAWRWISCHVHTKHVVHSRMSYKVFFNVHLAYRVHTWLFLTDTSTCTPPIDRKPLMWNV